MILSVVPFISIIWKSVLDKGFYLYSTKSEQSLQVTLYYEVKTIQ